MNATEKFLRDCAKINPRENPKDIFVKRQLNQKVGAMIDFFIECRGVNLTLLLMARDGDFDAFYFCLETSQDVREKYILPFIRFYDNNRNYVANQYIDKQKELYERSNLHQI